MFRGGSMRIRTVIIWLGIMSVLLSGAVLEGGPFSLFLVKEVSVGDEWSWVEDYFVPFGRDMSVQCFPERTCEIATGIAHGDSNVGPNNRGPFSGNKEFVIGPIGAVYVRMADGKGEGKIRYYSGKIGTNTWPLP